MRRVLVRLTAAAERDLREASHWYRAEAPAFDPIFRQAVRDCLHRISENALQYPVVYGEIHRAVVRRFPYSILYRRLGENAQVIAIIHQSRGPKIWRRRL